MNYRIEEKEAFQVFGLEAIVHHESGNNFITIPQFWDECFKNGTFEMLQQMSVSNSVEHLGKVNAIMCYEMSEPQSFPYMIGVIDFDNNASAPSHLKRVAVAPYTWAIFRTENHHPSKTPENIQGIWKKLFSEWLPELGLKHTAGPDLELYYNVDENTAFSEVWVPVEKM